MARFNSPLDHVGVAAPCDADWDEMLGDERRRFCGQCNLHVYNLTAMKKSEAEDLVMRSEGRLCVRFYRRKDGSIITDNCPVGLRALRRKFSAVGRAVASAVLTFLAGFGLFQWLNNMAMVDPPNYPVAGEMIAEPPHMFPVSGEVFMGDTAQPFAEAGRLIRIDPIQKRKLRRIR